MLTGPNTDSRRERYVCSALESELAEVRSAGPGNRNAALFRAAASLATIAAAGGLDEDSTRAALEDAATCTGLPTREARSAIRSGWRRGAQNRRELPCGDARTDARARTVPRPVPAPVYPPVDEVQALWADCQDVRDASILAPEVDYLERFRKFRRELLGSLDQVRILPPADYPWPHWVPHLGLFRTDWRSIYGLAVQLFDSTGTLRSLRLRAITHRRRVRGDSLVFEPVTLADGTPIAGHQKALAARGCAVAGLTLADPLGLALLRGERAWDGVEWDGRVMIFEGEPDLWRAQSLWPPVAGRRFAGLSIVAGAWTPDLAARVPDGAEVQVWTHWDAAGEKYAAIVAKSLSLRCDVRRAHLSGEED